MVDIQTIFGHHSIMKLKPISVAMLSRVSKTNGQCSICRKPFSGNRANVHHINHDPSDDRLSNLALLCQKCHRNYHFANGKSLTQKDTSIPAHGVDWAIAKFDARYKHLGGYQKFVDCYKVDNIPLAAIGRIFGFTRERARQLVIIFGLSDKSAGACRTKLGDKMKSGRMKNVYKYMAEKGIGIGELSDKTGIPYGQLASGLSGHRAIYPDDLLKISEVTGLPVRKILEITQEEEGGEESPKKNEAANA